MVARFSLTRVYVNKDGYDRSGGYWGTGQKIWQADNGQITVCFRAADKTTAKRHVRDMLPHMVVSFTN